MCRADGRRPSTPSRASAPIRRARCVEAASPGRADPGGELLDVAAAREFAERALRFVLEVLDLRRPAAQLAAVADPRVVASVRTLVASKLVPGRQLGAAALGRVTVVPVDGRTAEVCAGYDRGARHFALAARVVRGEPDGWRVAALRVR